MEYSDDSISERIRSKRLRLNGISSVALGAKPKALSPAMYARRRFSNASSYGMLRKTHPRLTPRFGTLRFCGLDTAMERASAFGACLALPRCFGHELALA